MDILRLEKLSPTSDTLICLIGGDAHTIEIHEPAEALHFGIDTFGISADGAITANKNIHAFSLTPTISDGVTSNAVTIAKSTAPVDISTCFRSASSRVLNMDSLVAKILQTNNADNAPIAPSINPIAINSAELGFAMTE